MASRSVTIRLVHDGAQPGPPVAEPVRFGLQDTKGEVHPGSPVDGAGAKRRFEAVLSVKGDGRSGPPVFGGVFCHGPPSARFLYLSWKREGAAHPLSWAYRIKMPLLGVGWPEVETASGGPGLCIEADVAGRRPHDKRPVAWRVVARGDGTPG